MEHNIAQHVGNHQVQVPARVMYEIVRPVLHLQHSTHTVETDSPKRHCEKWGPRTCVQLNETPHIPARQQPKRSSGICTSPRSPHVLSFSLEYCIRQATVPVCFSALDSPLILPRKDCLVPLNHVENTEHGLFAEA